MKDQTSSGVQPGAEVDAAARIARLEAELERLREQVTRYTYTSLASSDALFDHDLRSSRVWRDATYHRLYGAPEGDGDLSWWRDRIHPEDRAQVQQSLADAVRRHDAMWNITYRLLRPDGDYAELVTRSYIIYDADGEAVRVIGAISDVTEQATADRQIRRLVAYPRESPNPVLEADDQGVVQYRNPVANRLLQYFGCRIEDLLPDNHAAMVRRALELNPTHPVVISQYRERVFSWHYHPVPSANVVHIYGTDITERHEREAALRESEARFRSMADSAPVMIWVADRDGRLTWFNRPALAYTASSMQDNLGEGVFQYIHPEDRDAARAALARLVQTNEPEELQLRLRHHRAGYRWCQFQGAPRITDQGRIVGIIGSATDIHDQLQSQQELAANQERLNFIFNQLPAVIWTVDADLIITSTAGRDLERIGVTRDGYVGKHLSAFLAPGEEDVVDLHQRVLSRGDTLNYRTPFKGRIYRATIGPLHGPGGDVSGVIGITQDVTQEVEAESDRRQLEAQLLQTQKLESLGVLAGGIAHDFNNLLAGILGNVGLAQLELSADSEVHGILKNVENAAHRASELTHQMLAYSGRGSFIVARLDLNRLIQEMLDLLQVTLTRSARLDVQPYDSPVVIEADRAQIQQVIMNLVTNASDAIGDQNGVIRVTTGYCDADRDYLRSTYLDEDLPAGRYAWLEVEDTGHGMDQDTLQKIFDPFFSTKFTGRGLGLAAILGIIRGHRGAIDVQSEPGVGTTFRVLLPAAASDDLPASAPSVEEAEAGEGTVLIVDDETTVRTVAKLILERYGYRVLAAASGREALEVLAAHRATVDAVLLDLTMPEMSSEETLKGMRRLQPGIKVLLMSGFSAQEAQARFKDQYISGFLQKPFRAQDLRQKLQTVIAPEGG